MDAFIYPDQYRKTAYRETRINSSQVLRDILSPEEMDQRVKDLLSRHGRLLTGQIMKLSRVYPTHKEVVSSLQRIGATRVKRVYWSL